MAKKTVSKPAPKMGAAAYIADLVTGRYRVKFYADRVTTFFAPDNELLVYRHDGTAESITRALSRAVAGDAPDIPAVEHYLEYGNSRLRKLAAASPR